jgi:hypothetical protein
MRDHGSSWSALVTMSAVRRWYFSMKRPAVSQVCRRMTRARLDDDGVFRETALEQVRLRRQRFCVGRVYRAYVSAGDEDEGRLALTVERDGLVESRGRDRVDVRERLLRARRRIPWHDQKIVRAPERAWSASDPIACAFSCESDTAAAGSQYDEAP